MKILTLLLILFLSHICISQKLLESLEASEIEKIVVDNFRYHNAKYDSFKIFQPVVSDLDYLDFGDFDLDGTLDALVAGTAYVSRKDNSYAEREIFVITQHRKSFSKITFPTDYFRFLLSTGSPVVSKASDTKRDYVRIEFDFGPRSEARGVDYVKDSLVVEFNGFIPYRQEMVDIDLRKIMFETSGCYGSCPIFKLELNQDGTATYNGIQYVKNKGKHNLVIDKIDWNYLETLLQFIDLEALEENYRVPWTDDQTGFLTVYFGGSKKQIEDYGMAGNLGLSILYNYLVDLTSF